MNGVLNLSPVQLPAKNAPAQAGTPGRATGSTGSTIEFAWWRVPVAGRVYWAEKVWGNSRGRNFRAFTPSADEGMHCRFKNKGAKNFYTPLA